MLLINITFNDSNINGEGNQQNDILKFLLSLGVPGDEVVVKRISICTLSTIPFRNFKVSFRIALVEACIIFDMR